MAEDGGEADEQHHESMIVEQATVQDAAEILALQKLAYRDEAKIYGDYSIPPLTQTVEEIEAEFDCQLFLKASADGGMVGSVRAYMMQGTCFIGRLIVHPDYQNQGIGTRLMFEIEEYFDRASRFELFTGSKSARNLRLYRKLGYRQCRTQRLMDWVTLVFLEKTGHASRDGESTHDWNSSGKPLGNPLRSLRLCGESRAISVIDLPA